MPIGSGGTIVSDAWNYTVNIMVLHLEALCLVCSSLLTVMQPVSLSPLNDTLEITLPSPLLVFQLIGNNGFKATGHFSCAS